MSRWARPAVGNAQRRGSCMISRDRSGLVRPSCSKESRQIIIFCGAPPSAPTPSGGGLCRSLPRIRQICAGLFSIVIEFSLSCLYAAQDTLKIRKEIFSIARHFFFNFFLAMERLEKEENGFFLSSKLASFLFRRTQKALQWKRRRSICGKERKSFDCHMNSDLQRNPAPRLNHFLFKQNCFSSRARPFSSSVLFITRKSIIYAPLFLSLYFYLEFRSGFRTNFALFYPGAFYPLLWNCTFASYWTRLKDWQISNIGRVVAMTTCWIPFDYCFTSAPSGVCSRSSRHENIENFSLRIPHDDGWVPYVSGSYYAVIAADEKDQLISPSRDSWTLIHETYERVDDSFQLSGFRRRLFSCRSDSLT